MISIYLALIIRSSRNLSRTHFTSINRVWQRFKSIPTSRTSYDVIKDSMWDRNLKGICRCHKCQNGLVVTRMINTIVCQIWVSRTWLIWKMSFADNKWQQMIMTLLMNPTTQIILNTTLHHTLNLVHKIATPFHVEIVFINVVKDVGTPFLEI